MDKMVAEVMQKMSKNSKWKKFLGKKWTFPAIYMIAAALILTLMWWYQDPNEYPLTQEELGLQEITPEVVNGSAQDEMGEEAVAVATQTVEQMVWPAEDPINVQVKMEFFDDTSTEDAMAESLITFQGEYWPHNGIDIVAKDKKAFTAVAALSGEVVRADKDPVMGYVVELKHENGLITTYSSLKDVTVKKGDKISQGTPLGTADRNVFEKDHGIHLHFEVRKDDIPLNPNAFFGQDVNQVLEQLSQGENRPTQTENEKGPESKPNEAKDVQSQDSKQPDVKQNEEQNKTKEQSE